MKRKPRLQPREVFLSHASGDRRFADHLAQTLRRYGLKVWYSRTHLRGAQQWQDEIGQALRRCDWFVVILSPKSARSMWVKRELAYAMSQERYRTTIVPVLFRRCDYENLHWALGNTQLVDLTGDFTKGCLELLKIWKLRFRP